MSIKDAVFAVMPQAYAAASDNWRLPAPARQMGYACRRLTGLGDKLDMDYFLKKLLPAYLDEYPEETADWDIIRDPRGTFVEPHTDVRVPLGTLDVRRYLTGHADHEPGVPRLSLWYPTHGPQNRFGAILYIEKEGFYEQIAAAGVQERWDIAIASCKGYSVHAARRLLRELHERYEVPVLVAHDFDKAGIGIFDTLGDDGLVDIGLRLTDVIDERWGLADMSEPVTYGKDGITDPRPNLMLRGATPDEIQFLCQTSRRPFHGRRVELNALVGRTFIDWLEAKLEQHGVTKVAPDALTLEAAYRRAYELETINREIQAIHRRAAATAAAVEVPPNFVTLVTDALEEQPELAWDDVIASIVTETLQDTDA